MRHDSNVIDPSHIGYVFLLIYSRDQCITIQLTD